MLLAFVLFIAKSLNQYIPVVGHPLAGLVTGIAATIQFIERAIIG